MAGTQTVLSNNSLLSQADRLLLRIERPLAMLSGLAVFALILLAVVSVGGRNFFGAPVPGYVDWIEQAMPLIAFMGLAYTQRDGAHIRMDMAISWLRGRALWAAEFVSVVAMLVLTVLLIWGSWAHFARSFDFAAPMWSRDSTIDIGLPLWPAKLLAPVALSVLALRLSLQLWGYGRAFVRGTETAIAVPLVETPSEAAVREAAQIEGGTHGD